MMTSNTLPFYGPFPRLLPFVVVDMDVDYLREHEESTKLKTIGKIKIGEYLVETWYFSAYPKVRLDATMMIQIG